MTTEGIDVRSVGNTLVLHETALVEAFNLKAAIEFQLKNCEYPGHRLLRMWVMGRPVSTELQLGNLGYTHCS